MNNIDRDNMDTKSLLELEENLSYSLPYTQYDMEKAFYAGQMTLLAQIKAMLVGHSVNGVFTGVITENDVKELINEKRVK
jgi:hypothetical protein